MLQIRAFLLVLGELVHKHLPVYLPENQPESQKFYRTRKRTAAPTCMTVCQVGCPLVTMEIQPIGGPGSATGAQPLIYSAVM